MADTISTSAELAIGITNSLEKIEYIRVPNPKDSVTEQSIKTALQPFINNRIIIDNGGEAVSSESQITTAYTDHDTVHNIDLA